jgi:hypothetical protein
MRRLAALAVAMVGCGSPPPPQPVHDLALHAELAALEPSSDISISAAHLHLTGVTAVSDRSSSDPRAQVAAIDLSAGDSLDEDLPAAPPGLYSAVELTIGDANAPGIDVQAVWQATAIHVTISGGAFDVGCASPVTVALGDRARLSLRGDPASWFAGVDLSGVESDADDNGIVIGDDDNAPQAAVFLSNVLASLTLDCARAD